MQSALNSGCQGDEVPQFQALVTSPVKSNVQLYNNLLLYLPLFATGVAFVSYFKSLGSIDSKGWNCCIT